MLSIRNEFVNNIYLNYKRPLFENLKVKDESLSKQMKERTRLTKQSNLINTKSCWQNGFMKVERQKFLKYLEDFRILFPLPTLVQRCLKRQLVKLLNYISKRMRRRGPK